MERTILVFGDSIIQGSWDREGGWVQRLRSLADQKNLSEEGYYVKVFNMGVSGDTTRGLLERVDQETKARFKEKADPTIIYSIGTNEPVPPE